MKIFPTQKIELKSTKEILRKIIKFREKIVLV